MPSPNIRPPYSGKIEDPLVSFYRCKIVIEMSWSGCDLEYRSITNKVDEVSRMGRQSKKYNQCDSMGSILMNSDFKKSLTKAMPKGRK